MITNGKDRTLAERVRESAVFLYGKGVLKPEIGIILGSGLNDFADRIKDPLIISYNDVPNMEAGLVSDHRGQIVYGRYKGKRVIIMAGRFHYYENRDNADRAVYGTMRIAFENLLYPYRDPDKMF